MTGVLAAPAVIPLRIDQGATFRWTVNYVDNDGVPIDLVGRSAHMQIRSDSSGALLADLTELTGITVNAANTPGRD
jgi:hypothetical protein